MKISNNKKILVAAAWPYANGTLHLGHVTGLIGADVLARYHRLKGDDVLFVSGSDCYGTPITVEAEKRNVTPKEIANKYHNEFVKTLIDGLKFSYDLYSKTDTENHQKLVQELFLDLYKKEYIYKDTEELPFCEHCSRFLPDRFIEGECPQCGFHDARGDQCDDCGKLMDTKTLINPRCKLCDNTPVWKDSEHFYLKLTAFQDQLKKWVEKSTGWRANAKNFTLGFLEEGLHDRAITRDSQWGVEIPLEGYEGKRIYVWFEAVCGYYTASREWSDNSGNSDAWKAWWENKEAFHYYVHGKDNVPFHTVIWPAIMMGQGKLNLPNKIISSAYLTLEGKQLSKSRNWAVWIPDFLKSFKSDTLRYYLTANGAENSDIDFSWTDFQNKVNGELIGNYGNLAQRVLAFAKKRFDGKLAFPSLLSEEASHLMKTAEDSFEKTGTAIESGKFREATKIIFQVIDEANKFLSKKEPWKTIKTDPKIAEADLAVAGHAVICSAILLSPFIPDSSNEILSSIGMNNISWTYPKPKDLKINEFNPLFKRVEDEEVTEQKNKLG